MKTTDLKRIVEEKRYSLLKREEWETVERKIGTALPNDYKRIIEELGACYFDEFLWILSPFEKNTYMNFFENGKRICDVYKECKSEFPEEFTHSVFPSKGGILPFGITDNGDELYWLTTGNCDSWSIVVYGARSSEYYEYAMSLVEFLSKVALKEIICPAFPDDFPSEEYEIKAYE